MKRLITQTIVNSKFNLEDNFTKVLPMNSIDYASIGIGLSPINTTKGSLSNARLMPGLTIQCGYILCLMLLSHSSVRPKESYFDLVMLIRQHPQKNH